MKSTLMGPSRKRPRTKAPNADETTAGASNPDKKEASLKTTETSVSSSTTSKDVSKAASKEDATSSLKNVTAEPSNNQLNPKASWYGTWPRKATASTKIARETILADHAKAGSSSTDLGRFEHKKSSSTTVGRPPSMYLGKSKETLDVTMANTLESEGSGNQKPDSKASTIGEEGKDTSEPVSIPASSVSAPEKTALGDGPQERPSTGSGWLGGWLGRTPVQPIDKSDDDGKNVLEPETSNVKEMEVAPSEPVSMPPSVQDTKVTAPPTTSSWFGLWSTAPPSTAEPPKEQMPTKVSPKEDTVMRDNPTKVVQPAAGSSWAFWSTEPAKKATAIAGTVEPEPPGELAIKGDVSQDHPEPAKTTTIQNGKNAKTVKRGRPQSLEVDELTRKATQDVESAKATPSQSPAPSKSQPSNLLLPSVNSTYRLVENPSILQQIARLLLHGQQKPVKHVSLVKDIPKIKTALAIGIHGLFPAPLLRTVIGQPTGTSIKFANHAAEAIRRWTDAHGSVECEIEKVALEGEGKIAERVDNLWKLLLNWIDHVRKADFIMVACHSQGVPVAVMLVAKLVEFGVVTNGRIGICAMAGVSLGPFADYKSRLFSGSAGELFEFANPESGVSKRYEDSLRVILKYGVKITYCGSIDDQLVSMESSIFSTVSHPYIFRAVFVDGRIHAPDFLAHLIGFALKLRNLGVSDHGLIREMSAPLAGSLYTGEGHSRLYDEGKIYDLATQFTLETNTVGDIPLQTTRYEIPSNANPYVLPWIMRGLLEEDFVKTELDTETTELLKEFDDWKPATKVLKDVKYRLEAVRSKL